MDLSRRLARIIGPSLVLVAASEALNLWALAGNPPGTVYLNGTVFAVAGIAIVQCHSRWRLDWTVLVTLVGWGLIALGAYRMFAPTAAQLDRLDALTGAIFVVLAAIGLMLTISGYRPQNRRR